MTPIAILGSGMVTGVGLDAPSTCAAMRAAISNFAETRFVVPGGEWLMGCTVPLDGPWRGRTRLAHLVAPAIRECLNDTRGVKPASIPLLLCVAEPDRPGRIDELEDGFIDELQALLGVGFHPRSSVIARGRVGVAVALDLARKLIRDERLPLCLVAGVDSMLNGMTIAAYESSHRLLTEINSNGFIPGEAGAAVLIGPAGSSAGAELRCLGIGFGREEAVIESDKPLRADGLVESFRAMYRDGGVTLDDADYRYTDCNGEQYGFKEDRLAITRVIRKLKYRFDHLHPADSIGEVGAAVGPCVLGLALTAARKGYAPSSKEDAENGRGVLCHFGNDDGERASLLLRYVDKGGPQ